MSFWQDLLTIGDAAMRGTFALIVVPIAVVPVFIASGLIQSAFVVKSLIEDIFDTGPILQNDNVLKLDAELWKGALVKEGITITQADHERVKKELGFEAGSIHIAIAGGTGAGKSSLINSFRGLRPKDPFAAPTGIVECTRKITRYPDPRYPWLVWFDFPGGGTKESPSAGYFERNGLYVMDCIIIVCGDRFSELDIEILKRAHKWNIRVLVVRSKSDVHIRNLAIENVEDPDDKELYKQSYELARIKFIEDSKKSFEHNLKLAGLTAQFTSEDLFLVSAPRLRQLMTGSEDIAEAKEIEKEASSSSVQNEAQVEKWRERLQAAREKYVNKLLSSPGFIDEQRLALKVFSSIGKSRYKV
ncbi:interferon-inducible GTPase-domain-containing protein [Kalaharituber pfeilii]|nr:interferon-inducible GTPase-domain-containing protein [Kalaharituber pfeilii]